MFLDKYAGEQRQVEPDHDVTSQGARDRQSVSDSGINLGPGSEQLSAGIMY